MRPSKAKPPHLLFLDRPLVLGVGIYRKGHYTSWKDGKITSEYNVWISMLQKCYGVPDSGYEVSEEFKDFQTFAAWCNEQVGFKLEKPYFDIALLGGSSSKNATTTKCYSRDTCVFLPVSIARNLASNPRKNSSLPLGISLANKRTGSYMVNIRVNLGQQIYLGSFHSLEEAARVYKEAKEAYIRQMAESFKAVLDKRAYEALVNFKIE